MASSFQLTLRTALAAALAGCIALNAQTDPIPGFEVVSIKAHRPDDPQQRDPQFSPGYARFISTGSALRYVIAFAYGMSNQGSHLIGGPAWIRSSNATYDIEATIPKDAIPAGTPYSVARQKLLPMVQKLLRDRFQLQVHRDVAELPVYAVTQAKSGLLLQKAPIEERDCPGPDVLPSASATCHKLAGGRGRGVRGLAVTLNDLCQYLENWVDRPVVDETGIEGLFTIQTTGWREFIPQNPSDPNANVTAATSATNPDDLPTLFEVFEKLGLKLKPQKGRSAVIVIDGVEKPSEN
jgi:uncharacterized protein (TIGR03435 family)